MERLRRSNHIIGVFLAITGVILFSVKAVYVKMSYGYHVDPISLILIRMMFSLPVYLVITIIVLLRKDPSVGIKWKHIPKVILFGFLGYYLSSYLDFTGLQYVSASLERLILFVYPTMVVIISAVIYNIKVTQKQVLGIIVAYFGVFLIFFQRSEMDSHSAVFLGSLLVLGCAFTYAVYLVGSGSLIPVIGPALYTSLAMIISTLAVVIHYNLRGGDNMILSYPKELYYLGIKLSIISTVLPSFMISEAIKRIGATRVAIIGSVGPISTIVLASLYLGEKINAFQWMGSIIVVSGVLLVNLKDSVKEIKAKANDSDEIQSMVG